jgi:hypothetical protein
MKVQRTAPLDRESRSIRFVAITATALGILVFANNAAAVSRMIGDADGFGIKSTTGLMRATPAPHNVPADTNGNGIIEVGEFLPDLNLDGHVVVGGGDDFENRSTAEVNSTDGAQFTDRSLTPAPAADGATFTFTFAVPLPGADDYGVNHYINFVFGDYDIVPAYITVDGVQVSLTTQPGGQDGLVQMAYGEVPWSAMTDGQVIVTLVAPNEPYLAVDYVLLDTNLLADDDHDGIPNSVDNCPSTFNPGQLDTDKEGLGDACDVCPNDPSNDADGDSFCGNVDNCPSVANPDQSDSDGDGVGDACDSCLDADHDGVCFGADLCEETRFPESVPTVSLGVNRWVLGPGGVFVTAPSIGKGPVRTYTLEATHGCSCEQIIWELGLGEGHTKFGCSISAMDEWVTLSR